MLGGQGHHDEPTVVIEEPPYLMDENEIVMDLARRPNRNKMAAYAKLVEGLDPFEVSQHVATISPPIHPSYLALCSLACGVGFG